MSSTRRRRGRRGSAEKTKTRSRGPYPGSRVSSTFLLLTEGRGLYTHPGNREEAERPRHVGGGSDADGALVVHGAFAAQVHPAPFAGGTGTGRGAAIPSGAQDRRGHRRGAFGGRGAFAGDARDGWVGAAQRGDTGRAAGSLADGFRRRCALRGAEPAPRAGTDCLRDDYTGGGDRADFDDLQHGGRADLPAVPGAASGERGQPGEHFARRRLRAFLVSRIPGHRGATRRATTG